MDKACKSERAIAIDAATENILKLNKPASSDSKNAFSKRMARLKPKVRRAIVRNLGPEFDRQREEIVSLLQEVDRLKRELKVTQSDLIRSATIQGKFKEALRVVSGIHEEKTGSYIAKTILDWESLKIRGTDSPGGYEIPEVVKGDTTKFDKDHATNKLIEFLNALRFGKVSEDGPK